MTDNLKLVEWLKNNRAPEQKVERNIAIWRDWISGLNHIEIGEKYGVSNGRVGQIIKKITPLIIKYVNGPLNSKLFLYPSKHPHWAQDAISEMWWAQDAIRGMWIESIINEDLDEIFRFHFGDSKGRVVIQSRPK